MLRKPLAFIRRDFRTQASYRLDFIMRIAGILVSIAIFYFISQILGTAVNPYLDRYGTDYFHFALLGIAFYPFIGKSTNSLSGVIHEYQQNGTLEILFVSPTPFFAALVMSTLWGYCWAFGEMLFYLGFAGVVFGAELSWYNIWTAVLIVILTILANAGLGLVNAAFVLVTKRSSPLARFLGLFTNLLAGVYYPVEVLPEWLRFFGYLLPATYSFEALRQSMLQGATLTELWFYVAALLLFFIFLAPLGWLSFRYAIRWAKMDGSLSQY
jgi:ABC-2 type transport system permease protein